MPNIYHGKNPSGDRRYAIVVARWNEAITKNLLDGAVATLTQHGVADADIDVAWTPGAFEIPVVADQMAGTGQYAAVICLGAVIRGETSHDQHINRAVSLGITEVSLRHAVPVLFGILTCDDMEQARARSQQGSSGAATTDGKQTVSNKGVECAEAALEMVDLLDKLPTG